MTRFFRNGARLAGHPVHAWLVHVPLGLLAMLPLWDALSVMGAGEEWRVLAYWTRVVGIGIALPAVAAGVVDYTVVVVGSPAERRATWHLGVMFATIAVFSVAFIFGGPSAPISDWIRRTVLGLDVLGALMLAVGGWLGGELVYGHGVGVRGRVDAGPDTPERTLGADKLHGEGNGREEP